MSDQSITLWQSKAAVRIPGSVNDPEAIVPYAVQLTNKDKAQVVSAFRSEHYEMVGRFVWSKSIAALRRQLSKLGMNFISEMLDRPDIDENSSIDQKLTDFEAIRLAEELGVISGTAAFRLRQSLETLNHFGSLPLDEAEEWQMTAADATLAIRACVESVLGQERIEAALDFQKFRSNLETQQFKADDEEIERLLGSPYFFHRACIRILLSLIKSTTGAQLENVLANTNLIIPALWPSLRKPEHWQIGRNYAELFAEGRSTATSGLRKVLLKVKGFDYVPEDLRSRSYVKAAHAVLEAHEGANNFYNEPAPTKTLQRMGSTIPIPAFPICMSAVLCVRLGNAYGFSWDAQTAASAILSALTKERWTYYLNDCLPTDERVLYKMLQDNPVLRWKNLVKGDETVLAAAEECSNTDIRQLIAESRKPTSARLGGLASKLIRKLGYSTG